jgi:hypothetical protein
MNLECYSLTMMDSYGDGWSGNELNFMRPDSGFVVQGGLALNSGAEETIDVCFGCGCFVGTVDGAGSYLEEVSWTLVNETGYNIATASETSAASFCTGFECATCEPGSGPSIDGSSCVPCAAGSHSNTMSSAECTPCGAGSYGTVDGSASADDCKACEIGKASSSLVASGASACGICPAGTSSNEAGSEACTDCEYVCARAERRGHKRSAASECGGGGGRGRRGGGGGGPV